MAGSATKQGHFKNQGLFVPERNKVWAGGGTEHR